MRSFRNGFEAEIGRPKLVDQVGRRAEDGLLAGRVASRDRPGGRLAVLLFTMKFILEI